MKKTGLELASVFILSCACIAYEIAVTRTFSVGSWSNFGAMVISIALLGFGIAGTILTFIQKHVRKHLDTWLFATALLSPPAMACAHVLAQALPFNPILITTDPVQLLIIAGYYIVYSIPFVTSAFFIGVAFIALSAKIHDLYFWNMAGSGLGGFAVLGFMYVFPPDALIACVCALAGIAGLFLSLRHEPSKQRLRINIPRAAFVLCGLAASIAIVALFGKISVSDFKSISYVRKYPQVTLDHYSFSPLGEMHVYSSSFFHFAPGLSDNASGSLEAMPRNAFKGLFIDGGGPVGIMRKLDEKEAAYIDFLPMSCPYVLLDEPSVLVVNLGGGAGVFTALHHGARNVTAVEPNAEIVRLLRDTEPIRSFNAGLLTDPRVKVRTGEPRAFTAGTSERFGLVELSLIDSVGLSQTGGYPVVENFTYTAEAFADYMKCLDDGGILSVTVWNKLSPPRNFPRLLSTIVRSLELQNVKNPERRIYVFSMLLQTATVLVKKGDFSKSEIGLLNAECGRLSFDVSYYHGIQDRNKNFEDMLSDYRDLFAKQEVYSVDIGDESEEDSLIALLEAVESEDKNEEALVPSDFYHYELKWIFEGKKERVYSDYIFDIRPATDDRPYYTAYIKPDTIGLFLNQLNKVTEEWGYLLLVATLVISIFAAALIILLPIIGKRKELFARRSGAPGVIVYYGCLGLGYMLVEIFLIQKLVFFLEDPVFSLSIVLTSMLVISGAGSLLSKKIGKDPAIRVRIASAVIGLSLVFYIFGLTPLANLTLALPFIVKVALAILFIAPSAFFMGIPFPTGLSALNESREGLLPWAWGMNGALSVTGSVFARLFSVSYGFTPVLLCAIALYLLVGLIFPVNTIKRQDA